MTGPLAPALRSKILRLLLLHWTPPAIAEEVHCHRNTVYTMQENLFMYGSPFRPQFRPKGAPRKVFPAAEDSLITYLEQQPWAMQKEMVWFLWEEWGIHVHQSTISRILKKRHWSNKKGQRVGIRQNDELRFKLGCRSVAADGWTACLRRWDSVQRDYGMTSASLCTGWWTSSLSSL